MGCPQPLHSTDISLQELASVEMLRKYAHLVSDHLVQYVDGMSGIRVVQDGKGLRFRLKRPNEKGPAVFASP